MLAGAYSDSSLRAAEQICENEINILVDLDSITLDTACELMTLFSTLCKSLGWDGMLLEFGIGALLPILCC